MNMTSLNSVAFSVLDLAPVQQGKTIADSFRNTLDLARHAEGWGYRRFWLAEHHNMAGIASAATAVLIGYVAGGTSSIRVGSGGIMLPNHAPLVIAEQFGTLETLYPGRIDLGLGRAPGTDGVTVRALRRDPTAASDFPDQVRELLTYLGAALPGQKVRAVPGQGTNVPVWLLGSSTFSAQLAAHLGLPFAFAGHFAPQDMREAIYLYRAHFRPSERLDRPYIMVGLPVIAAETDREAQILATTPMIKFLQLVRGEPFLAAPPVESMEGLWTPEERLLVQSKLSAAIVGDAKTVERRLSEFAGSTGIDEIMINSDVFEHAKRLRSYEIVAEVMKKLNSAEVSVAAGGDRVA
jgi:luciferase family oxidoreductase group 1